MGPRFLVETERLTIRPWEPADHDAFRALATDPLVIRYMTMDHHTWNEQEIDAWLARQGRQYADDGVCMGPLVRKEDGRIIGIAGIQRLGTTGDYEIGYWLAPDCWRRGYAVEAARALVDYAFTTMDLPRVVACAHPDNKPSIAVMEKLGMRDGGIKTGVELGHRMPDLVVSYHVLPRFRIETERLLIRPWRSGDRDALAALARDPRVMQYITIGGRTWNDDEVDAFLARQAMQMEKFGVSLGALVRKEDDRVIGLAGIQPLGATGDYEIGWWLAPDCWRRGYALEAGRALVGFAFTAMDLPRVAAIAQAENARSIAIMDKLGMRDGGFKTGVELGHRVPELVVSYHVLERPTPGAV